MTKTTDEQIAAIQKLGLGNNQAKKNMVITTRAKIRIIQKWADDNPKFDRSFIDEMEIYYRQKRCLTDPQIKALDKIISKFNIDVESYT